jgi:hypothetical protein
MEKAHKIVADFIIKYLRENNLDTLTKVIAGGKYVPRGETYLLNVEEQIAEIKEDIYNAVWYLWEFFERYEEDIFSKIWIGRYDYDKEDVEVFYVFCIDNQYIKCIYNCDNSNLILVEPKLKHFGKIDLNWFNTQLERNFQSDISEVLQDIKNHIEPLETNQDWVETAKMKIIKNI